MRDDGAHTAPMTPIPPSMKEAIGAASKWIGTILLWLVLGWIALFILQLLLALLTNH
jgi:hypothetical protein